MSDGQNTAAVIGILKNIAPLVGTVLSGGTPLGGIAAAAAVDFLASKLGVQDKSPEALAQAVVGLPTSDILKLENDLKKHLSDNELQLDLGQIDVDKEESKSKFLFVAGWRPYIGWICGTAIGYQFLLRPICNGLVALFHGPSGAFPALEIQDLVAIVVTMLGHSALRSYDKKNGVAA